MKNMKNKLFVTLGILGMSLLSYAGTKHSLETVIVNYYLTNSIKEDYRTLCNDFYQIVHNDYLNYKIALERFR